MKTKLIVVMVMLSLLIGCGKPKEETKKEEPSRPVKTMVLSDANQGVFNSYPGKVSAKQKVDISFEVSGRINALPGLEGDKVKKGDLLATLDPRDYQYKVNEEEAKFTYATKQYYRYKELWEQAVVAKSEYDEKRAYYEVTAASLETAKKALRDTKIYAPFGGIVASRYVELHEYVIAKQPIFSIQDMSELEIKINVPEQDVARAESIKMLTSEEGKKDIVGFVTFPTVPDQEYPLKVKEFEMQADAKTQTYTATMIMKHPNDKIILPGMTATVRIKFVLGRQDYYLLPIDALSIDTDGHYYAWLVNDDTKRVKKQKVTVEHMIGNEIKVIQGLKKGDRVVTAGAAYLRNDMKVRLITGRIGKDDAI